ncbi:MAG: GNAT family N-acetyltransferase, partial [Oligoflexia bacterium]|nr:GNAT family N-acetyltransferase [Oligoflexia bacterium]
IMGYWEDCFLFKVYYKNINKGWTAKLISKEYLYSLSLDNIENVDIILKPGVSVKFLINKDFKQWDILYCKFLEEICLPTLEREKDRRYFFENGVKNKHFWGVFLDKKLISIANYDTRYKDIGLISGVFTLAEERGKGYSKLCIKQIFIDSKAVHEVNNLILFTRQNSIIANNLYESLGFKQIGYFGVIFN